MNADERRLKATRLVAVSLLVAGFWAALPVAAQVRPLAPVDEAAKDGTWTTFRAALVAAVEKRDLEHVLAVLDPDVRNGSDSPRGIEEFRTQWHLDAADSPFWGELGKALALGSAWLERDNRPRELCAPFVLAKWPRDMDPLDNGVVVARVAPVKAGPTVKSATIGTLGYAVVPVTDWEVDDSEAASRQKWVKIRLRGRDGFIAEEQMRSPIEHAACFAKTPAGWRLMVFGPAGRD